MCAQNVLGAGSVCQHRSCLCMCEGVDNDKNQLANCSVAHDAYAHVRNMAQGWKRMESEKNRRAHCSVVPDAYAHVRNMARGPGLEAN